MIEKIICVEIPVLDAKKSTSFYERTLGLKKTYECPYWASFDVNGAIFALAVTGTREVKGDQEICNTCSLCMFRYGKDKDRDVQPTALIYLKVDDIDKVYQELESKGGKIY